MRQIRNRLLNLFFCRCFQPELSPDCINDQVCRTLYAQQIAVEKQVAVAGVVYFTAGVRTVIFRPCLVHFFNDSLGFCGGKPQRQNTVADSCLIGGKDVAAYYVFPFP